MPPTTLIIMENNNIQSAATNVNNIIDSWSFLAFGCSHGDLSIQECKTPDGKDTFNALVFTNPATDVDTMVGISRNLGDVNITEEWLMANYDSLQVVQVKPDEETIARRKARLASGKACQLESYILCRKGESPKRRKIAFDFSALARR